jgi:hypothetical protein
MGRVYNGRMWGDSGVRVPGRNASAKQLDAVLCRTGPNGDAFLEQWYAWVVVGDFSDCETVLPAPMPFS